MIYRDFQGEKLSMLGFGTMRLPLIPGGGETDIDQAQVDKMTDYAIEHGVNSVSYTHLTLPTTVPV